ncbi:MAG: AMP-binding protein [Gammaproteobacteria bacterium]|nr:AMP-binding protein [Gammaproteobacteria bacterium]MDH5799301.1 AMP-binding protein [Gammaproteobacteria bacterium]
MNGLQKTLAAIMSLFYKVEVRGLEKLKTLDENVIIVANHTSFLDALLLYCFIPINMTFAVNTHVAGGWVLKFVRRLVHLFPMDPGNPLAIRALIRKVQEGENVVIFPEGRITVTGSLMKIYHGPGLVAVRTNATVVPVCIDGAQYSPFSRMKGRIRTRWFPEISLSILDPRKLKMDNEVSGRARRTRAGKILSDVMTEMVFASSPYRTTIFDRLLDARIVHGGKHIVGEDINRKPINYDTVVTKCLALGKELTKHSSRGEYVGVLLPGALSTLVTFMGLHAYGRVPAMLNYTVGAHGMISACETAQVKTVVTAHAFVIKAKLQDVVHELSKQVNVVYLEDIAKNINLYTKIRSFIISKMDFGLKNRHRTRGVSPESPAVVLFTSGSEGTPKGVVLSHQNLLANMSQMASRIDFTAQDIVLNALPTFHSFGLTAGTLLPVLSGMKTFLYPSPLHYRVIPEIAYEIGATILFGTNTFLAGYAKNAHPYDFYSVRYVFAGAEKLKTEVRRTWEDKFGVRIFEGYGATETSPVLAVNTPMDNKPGTVGRLLPAIKMKLEPVPGLSQGRRLFVQGPNVMLGYLLHDNPGVLAPLPKVDGEAWYDTGDIVDLDDEGFVAISGRAKRFAKVAGEMVSLTAVESLASKVWPDAQHAAVAVPDERKGEQIVLMSTQANADRTPLLYQAQQDGIGEINVPKKVMQVVAIPILGTGKTDYVTAQTLVHEV